MAYRWKALYVLYWMDQSEFETVAMATHNRRRPSADQGNRISPSRAYPHVMLIKPQKNTWPGVPTLSTGHLAEGQSLTVSENRKKIIGPSVYFREICTFSKITNFKEIRKASRAYKRVMFIKPQITTLPGVHILFSRPLVERQSLTASENRK